MSKLPLNENYEQNIYSNQEGVDIANQKLLKQLQRNYGSLATSLELQVPKAAAKSSH